MFNMRSLCVLQAHSIYQKKVCIEFGDHTYIRNQGNNEWEPITRTSRAVGKKCTWCISSWIVLTKAYFLTRKTQALWKQWLVTTSTRPHIYRRTSLWVPLIM